MAKDPVCGMEVDEKTAKYKSVEAVKYWLEARLGTSTSGFSSCYCCYFC